MPQRTLYRRTLIKPRFSDIFSRQHYRDRYHWLNNSNIKIKQNKSTIHSLYICASCFQQESFSLPSLIRTSNFMNGNVGNFTQCFRHGSTPVRGNHKNFDEENALVASLKACAKHKDISKGSRIHADILQKGLHKENLYIGNTLVNMYSKCGDLVMAQKVFDELPVQDVVSWTALISGYVQHGHAKQALDYFDRMRRRCIAPNAVTFSCILKACGSAQAAKKGKEIHDELLKQGLLENNVILGTALVDMYAKCGILVKAREVFEELPMHNVVSWNALIAGYIQRGDNDEALCCFEQMQLEGFKPDAVTFSSILKACGSIRAIEKGKDIHFEIVKEGLLAKDTVIGNALVDMYAKCGVLDKAQEVLDELHVRDVISWNALITGYSQHGHGNEAISCFQRMQSEGVSPDPVTYSCILKACGSVGAKTIGREIHMQISTKELMNNTILGNALIDMYGKCGEVTLALKVFEEIPVRDIVSWNALIAVYAQQGQGQEALSSFEEMCSTGISPDALTLSSILKACGSIGAAEKGEEIHALITKEGLLQKNDVIGNALVDMYAKCGALEKARKVFSELPSQDVISWNALMAGYTQHGQNEESFNCFERMCNEGLQPDVATYSCIVKACGSLGLMEKAKAVHAKIVRDGMLEKHSVLGNALVEMYGKCGALEKAREVFDSLRVRDVVSWNVLMTAYAQNEEAEEALNCFDKMNSEGLSADAPALASILRACGSIGAIDRGKEVHAEIIREDLMAKNAMVGNMLVDMYAKCGALEKAKQVFDGLTTRNVVSWTALVAGYAQQGKHGIVFDLFNRMISEEIEPDVVTFSVVLKSCSFAGLVAKGENYFEIMTMNYGICPSIEHHSCMVDLFARSGHFDKAVAAIKRMPSSDYLPAWFSLLNACKGWGNVEVGQFAFENAVRLDRKSAVAYLCMSHIYVDAGMIEDAKRIEAMRIKNEAFEKTDCAWCSEYNDYLNEP